jgi:outer membrane autotransporter protein
MRKLNGVHKWLVAILVAVLATSATAGLELVVTNPVTETDADLILYGNDYISITLTDPCEPYGMAALLSEASVANITILTPLITEISVTASSSGAYGMYVESGTIFSNDIYGSITAVATDSAYGIDANNVVVGQLTGTISATANDGSGAYGLWGTQLVSVYSISEDGSITASAVDGGAYGIGSSGVVGITAAMDGTITVIGQGSDNYGIYGTEVSLDDIGGTISVTTEGEASGAYGIYAEEMLTIGNISGDITAESDGDNAFAIYADGDIEIGDISGDITADAGGSNAYGIWSENGDSVVLGDISGSITASADGEGAWGITSYNGYLETGDISGDIEATAGGNGAYGLYAYESYIGVGDIHGSITATAGNNAYGFYSEDGDVYIVDVNGVISAETTSGADAYGIYADDYVDIGTITENGSITAVSADDNAYGIYAGEDVDIVSIEEGGSITATAAGDYAYGIYAADDLSIGDIDGDIAATANGTAEGTSGAYAYGIYAYNDITIGDISGSITAMAAGDGAYGIWSEDGDYVELGDISGSITATADGNDVYGVSAWVGSLDTGDISGDIEATAGGSTAVGLYAYESYIDIGDVHGSITATAANDAYGLYSESGEGGGDVYIGDVNGVISADATSGNDAYGIYGDGEVYIDSVTINGSITATAEGNAYGIYGDDLVVIGSEIGPSVSEEVETGAIEGAITAETTDGSNAYGIYSGGDVLIESIGENGSITATSSGDNAYGIYADDDVYMGDMAGSISATANGTAEGTDGDNAYGIYAGGNIDIGNINGSGSITAFAADEAALAIYAENGNVDIGDIAGTVRAEAQGSTIYGDAITAEGYISIGDITETGNVIAISTDDADGMWSRNSYISIGDIMGTVSADSGYGDGAFAINASDYIQIDSISGHVTASSGTDATAIGSWNSYVDIGDISGDITATAGGSEAKGLYAYDSYIEIGDVTSAGSITAEAESDAYGIYAEDSDFYAGDIDGQISGYANDGDYGYGIYADGDVDIDSIGSDGVVWGSAYGDYAYGIYAGRDVTIGEIDGEVYAGALDYALALHAGGTLDTTITGEVSAETYDGDEAIAISAYDSMDILIYGGDIFAGAQYYDEEEDDYYWEPAYAIRSGQFGMGWNDQAADDTVEIVAGSDIFGTIDLGDDGGDNDVLTLSGSNSYTGYITGDIANVEDVNITGGKWYVDGDAYNNANGIYMTGGILNWLGEVETLNIQGGTFSPGNSIGTTVVTGDFTLGEDSTFVVEVDDDENTDLVEVTGTVTLEDGEIAPTTDVENPHFITHDFTAVIITSETDITGEFGREAFTPYFDYEVVYDTEDPCDSSVALDITPADFTEHAVTKNQIAVGEALNNVLLAGMDMDDDTEEVLVSIRNLQYDASLEGGDGEPCLLDEFAPQDAMGLAQVSAATMFSFNDSMFDRVNNVLTGKPYAMAGFGQQVLASADGSFSPKAEEWRPFIKGIGSWGDMDGKIGVSGYSYNLYGLTAGADKVVNDNWLFGISFGGSTANVDYDKVGTEADIDTAMVALYGSYFKDNWHIDFTLGYGHNWYDSERRIVIGEDTWKASSDHDGNMYSVALQAGMNLGDETTIIEPIIGGGYTSISEDGYTETGADPLNLKVDSHTTDAFYSKVGMRFATEMKSQDNTVLVPEVGAFWIHDFSDAAELDSEFGDGSAFTVEGVEPDDSFNITAGLNAYFSDWRLFVNYGWLTSSSADSHTVKAGIQWNF